MGLNLGAVTKTAAIRRNKIVGIMKKPASSLQQTKHLYQKIAEIKRYELKADAGFTLVELLVVVILIGVIATIAAPSWFGFISQRRANAANEYILRALQEAQSQAKNTKMNYSVSLRAPANEVPQVAVHKGSVADIPPDNSSMWKSLGELSIQKGQIWMGTNANPTQSNQANTNINPVAGIPNSKVTVVTFDYMGNLLSTAQQAANLGSQGLIIAVATSQPNSNPPQPIASTKRCVKIRTLLGSMQAGNIDPAQPDQCKPL